MAGAERHEPGSHGVGAAAVVEVARVATERGLDAVDEPVDAVGWHEAPHQHAAVVDDAPAHGVGVQVGDVDLGDADDTGERIGVGRRPLGPALTVLEDVERLVAQLHQLGVEVVAARRVGTTGGLERVDGRQQVRVGGRAGGGGHGGQVSAVPIDD